MADDSATREGATSQNEEQQQQQATTEGQEGKEGERKPEDRREPPPSARDLLMADIEAKRQDQLRADGVDLEAPVAEGDGGKKPAAGDEDLDTERQLERHGAADEVLTLDSVRGRKFKHTVDGEEREFSAEDLIRKALKGEAADYRLEQATQLLEQARKEAEAIRAARARGEADPDAGKDDGKPAKGTDMQAAVTEAMNKLLDGDTASAAAGLVQFLTPSVEAPRADDIVDQAVAQIERRRILTQFYKDYQDVTSADKRLGKMVDEEFGDAVKSLGKEFLTDQELDQQLRAAGDRVRKWRDEVRGPTNDDDPAKALEERRNKKDELARPRPASTRTQTITPEAPVDSSASRSSAIAEIAKARGQPL